MKVSVGSSARRVLGGMMVCVFGLALGAEVQGLSVVPVEDITWFTEAAEGTTKYTISTREQLRGLRDIVNSADETIPKYDFAGDTVMLNANLDLIVYVNWMPIGKDRESPFRGTFDGGGHVISNVTVNRPDSSYQGLFGVIDGGGVQNLGLENVNITGSEDVGGLAGYIGNGKSIISNVYVTGTVSAAGYYAGGFAGSVLGSEISNCYSAVAVSGNVAVGGFVGHSVGLKLTNSYAIGAISSGPPEGASGNDGRHTGGLVGLDGSSSEIMYCAALNVAVKSPYGDGGYDPINAIGRIQGYPAENMTTMYGTLIVLLSENVAFDGMLNIEETTAWSYKSHDKRSGADITIDQIKADGTIGGRFTSDGGWTTENGKLPGLFGKAAPLPVHLGGTPVSVRYSARQQSTSAARFVRVSGHTLTLTLPNSANVNVYALNGAKVRAFDLSGGTHTLHLNNLPRGTYIVKAQSGAWNRSARVLVK